MTNPSIVWWRDLFGYSIQWDHPFYLSMSVGVFPPLTDLSVSYTSSSVFMSCWLPNDSLSLLSLIAFEVYTVGWVFVWPVRMPQPFELRMDSREELKRLPWSGSGIIWGSNCVGVWAFDFFSPLSWTLAEDYKQVGGIHWVFRIMIGRPLCSRAVYPWGIRSEPFYTRDSHI